MLKELQHYVLKVVFYGYSSFPHPR